MKTFSHRIHHRALTLIELLVILAVIAVLAALLVPALMRAKTRARRITCVSNLKMIGLAYRIWEGDNNGNFPMAVAETNGGTMKFITGPNSFRHYQAMSNELSTPIMLICPADESRVLAVNFASLNNSNISYFVAVDASSTNAQLLLAGDHNITNGTAIKNGILEVITNQAAGWTDEIHKQAGNFALADGSVQQVSPFGLRDAITNTGLATNRLQMPVFGP